MRDAEIHAGNLLAVDKHLEADHNHIVIAVLDGQCTVKRLIRRGSSWWLLLVFAKNELRVHPEKGA
jgi:DNA polymerase V